MSNNRNDTPDDHIEQQDKKSDPRKEEAPGYAEKKPGQGGQTPRSP